MMKNRVDQFHFQETHICNEGFFGLSGLLRSCIDRSYKTKNRNDVSTKNVYTTFLNLYNVSWDLLLFILKFNL